MDIKRGRPRENGMEPGRVFYRDCEVIRAYNESKNSGQKRVDAIRSTVEAVSKHVRTLPDGERVIVGLKIEFRT